MSDKKIKLIVLTPERSVYDDYVDLVTLPGAEGYFGVLANHIPLVTPLQIGVVTARKAEESVKIAVSGGFVEVQPDRVTVLADTAELAEWIDVERAEAARERAEKRITENASETDLSRAKTALRKASTRLEIARK